MIDTTNDMRKMMPNTEKDFLKFLDGIAHVEGTTQVEISDCPFTAHWKHKVDFVLTNVNRELLYVEVKGWMSYTAVNELRYLMQCSKHDFYILQVTNEDWMGLYEKGIHKRTKRKLDDNTHAQYEEIRDFINGQKTARQMADISRKRLEEFVKVRAGDLERWQKRLAAKANEKVTKENKHENAKVDDKSNHNGFWGCPFV